MQECNDLIENPTNRCACCLLLDTSGSMDGEPIEELNRGIQQFFEEIKSDDFASYSVELSIITFGGYVRQVMDFQTIVDVEPPTFYASGGTPMGQAVKEAINSVNRRKSEYKKVGVAYYQPWVVLMTDGAPTDTYISAANELKQLGNNKKLTVFGIGIGDGCNMNVLKEFCPDNRPPVNLKGFKFKDFFQWLSASLSAVSVSTPGTGVALTPIDGWASI